METDGKNETNYFLGNYPGARGARTLTSAVFPGDKPQT